MKTITQKAPYSPRARRCWAAVILILAAMCWVEAQAFVFTSNTTIGALNTDYEGQDLVISNCVLTVDGPHSFASVRLATGGTLTHSAAANGTISVTVPVLDEPQVLTGTNAVALVNSNIVLSSVVVKDFGGTLVYANNVDYVLGTAGGQTSLQRTDLSTIPDGSMVLVTYDYLYGSTNSGLNLTIAGDLETEPGAAINADGRGYSGISGVGRGGAAGSPISGGGGGHGGYGGISSSNSPGGTVYDSVVQPIDKGSGGGNGTTGSGGAGGGAIRLVVGGAARLNGSISANGANGTVTRSGGGAGGSIWLTAQTLVGTGTISSDGGAGEPIHGGGGGGGRIALYFATNLFSGTIVARGGSGFGIGGAGTLYREASDFSMKQVLLDNGGRSGTNTLIQVGNSADVTVSGGAVGMVSGSLTIRNLVLVSGSRLTTMNPTQPLTLTVSSATIQSGASLLLDGLGFPARSGSGYGGTYTSGITTWGSGAGHGGYGGFSGYTSAYPGMYYGNPTAPNKPGSGGGGVVSTNVAGAGGGVLRMTVTDALVLDGRISANGTSGLFAGGGGGSGGSLWLTVGTLSGTGSITASGGNGILPTGGGGSGGRIAIEFSTNLFAGSIAAYGGSGTNGGAAGTVYFKPANQNGSLVVDNGGNACTNTPLTVSGTYSLTVKGAARAQATSSQLFLSGLLVASNGWLLTAASPSSGYSVTVNGNATIATGGRYFADGLGFPGNQGPGAGRYYYYYSPGYSGGGGGHGGAGGFGGNSNAIGGAPYEGAISPNQAGSGGGYYGQDYGSTGGAGGGFISLTVTGTLLVNGSISANGTMGTAAGAGGGSGGTVRLSAGILTGAGSISADGGNGNGPNGGGGGGGRISMAYTTNLFAGTVSAFGGSGTKWGGAGTIYTKANNQQLGQLLLNNNGVLSTNTSFYESGFSSLTITGGAIGTLPALASVGTLTIASNSWLNMNTASLTVSGSAVLDAGGGITADGTGSPANSGPGAGSISTPVKGGGGHGGYGGGNFPSGGGVYGLLSGPTTIGSGGATPAALPNRPLAGQGAEPRA